MATSETPVPTTIALVKSGQVGRALLENLVEDTFGAKAVLEAAKRSSECNPDLGPLSDGAPALKTMKQTFMEQAELQTVKDAFEPLRLPQSGSDVETRQWITLNDGTNATTRNVGKLGLLKLPSGTINQVTGMVNVGVLTFAVTERFPQVNLQFSYTDSTGVFEMLNDGIMNFAGNLNLIMLPSGYEPDMREDVPANSESPIPYLNPTFLGTRGSNECEYRLSYHHYTGTPSEKSVPDIFHQETLFEGKFTHYDVAKNVEKRHSFNASVRVKAGDKLRFILERGRSIATFTGVADVIRTSCYLVESPAGGGRADFLSANQIGAIFLTD